MNSLNLSVKEIMAFVPSGKNYRMAIDFYKDLGFEVDWDSEELAIIRKGTSRFYLQNFANEEMQKNFMMNIEVENLNDWWQKIESSRIKEKYEGVRVIPPKVYPWGKREIHLIAPDGVLWHIATRISEERA